jgi:putative ABC transport system permease protein
MTAKPDGIKKEKPVVMIKNYLRTALRNLWRHRGFSLLNILGLTIGMTAFFLIFLYVRFEGSYDSFNTKADRIYRLVSDVKTGNETLHYNAPPVPVVGHLMAEFPELQQVTRVSLGDDWMVLRGDRVFRVDDVATADSNFFKVFDFRLLKGDPNTALKYPNSVILSESEAKKFFGNENPIGQSLTMTRIKFHATVTGLMQDIPENSHLKIHMIYSADTLGPIESQMWDQYGFNTYLLLKPAANAAGLQAKFPAFLQSIGGAALQRAQQQPTLLLEPLRDIYLYSTRDGSAKGHIINVRIFSIIGIFILLIAGINFVNLTTARSSERAKEVGIRKVAGASKSMLAGQFIGESIILSLIACMLSVLLSALLLPGFNFLAGKAISPGIFSALGDVLFLFGLGILIGISAGFYPALVLSSFQPVAVLKGRFSSGTRGIFLRKALVILQFTIAIGLIIATLIVSHQLNYMRSQDLGFNKDQELILDTRGDSTTAAFKQEISLIPGVYSTTKSSSVPGSGMFYGAGQIENVHGVMQTMNVNGYITDYDYMKQFGIGLAAGRDFSRQYPTDSTRAVILNETAVRQLGYSNPAQAVGKQIRIFGDTGAIIGVVKDFHFRSLQEPIRPLMVFLNPRQCDLLCVKVDGHRLPSIFAAIERKWKQMLSDRPFDYFFMDEFFDRQYRAEDRFGTLFLYFAILAISISCLGLMGLASYSTLQRTKEIGVRKVVGASVSQIVILLSKDFLSLVGWSFVVAAPISWLFMSAWLSGFAYRIHSYWWIFAAAGAAAMLVALATVSVQAVKAALADPVRSLRSE